MRNDRKLSVCFLMTALALLLPGVSSCGDDGESDSSGTSATTAESRSEERSAPASEGAARGGEGGARGNDGATDGEAGEPSGGFTPKRHEDSGGGSAGLRVKGGDNSVQEFGRETSGEEFEQAAAALHNFLDARAQREWEAACSYLASNIAKSFEETAPGDEDAPGASCAVSLEAFTNPEGIPLLRKEAAQADVASLRAEGDSGFVIYRAGQESFAIAMAKEGGAWKVASLAGYPLG